jgi:cell division protein FtsQ
VSNQRARTSKQSRRRAPADPEPSSDSEVAPGRRDRLWGWALTALKVTLGTAVVGGLSVALALGLHRYARSTPRFAITEVAVEGTRRLLRQEVLATAGIEPGNNIFVLDVAQAEERLVQSPWIKSARVSRRLPGSVKVEIFEQEPVALASLRGRMFLVSQEGEPFKEQGIGDPHDLPIITGISTAELKRDRRAEVARIREALVLLQDYEQLAVGRALPPEEVHLGDSGTATMIVGASALALHLGAPPFKAKLRRATKILSAIKAKGGNAGVVFLDNAAHPERVVGRLK